MDFDKAMGLFSKCPPAILDPRDVLGLYPDLAVAAADNEKDKPADWEAAATIGRALKVFSSLSLSLSPLKVFSSFSLSLSPTFSLSFPRSLSLSRTHTFFRSLSLSHTHTHSLFLFLFLSLGAQTVAGASAFD